MIKGMKTLVAALGVAGVLAGASAAQAADAVQINLTGNPGDWNTIQAIDLNSGNSLAVAGQTAAVGESFDVYFQSTVSALNIAGGGVVGGVGTTYYLTTVVKFSEVKTAEIPGVVAVFGEGSGTSEYFELWLSTTPPNDLTGLGFGADNAGAIQLLGGSSVTVSTGSFTVAQQAFEDMDQTIDGNQYTDILSVVGNGSTTISADIDFVNTDYIKGLTTSDIISLVLANPASTAAPFDAVNPAGAFWDALTSSYVTPDIGSINGFTGPDFQFQTNGNLTFGVTNTPVVPEPATAALGLLGLAGLAAASRRRR